MKSDFLQALLTSLIWKDFDHCLKGKFYLLFRIQKFIETPFPLIWENSKSQILQIGSIRCTFSCYLARMKLNLARFGNKYRVMSLNLGQVKLNLAWLELNNKKFYFYLSQFVEFGTWNFPILMEMVFLILKWLKCIPYIHYGAQIEDSPRSLIILF